MKKLFFIFILLISISVGNMLYGQLSQGTLYLGGSAGFDATTVKSEFNGFSDESSFSAISLMPTVGAFVQDNLLIGGRLNTTFFGGDAEGSSIGIGPFGRYYFGDQENLAFFGQAGASFLSQDPGENIDAVTGFGFNLGPGLALFPAESVAIEVGLTYDYQRFSDDEITDTLTSFLLSIGFGIHLQ